MNATAPEIEPRQLPNLIPTTRITLIGLAAMVLFTLGSLGATELWRVGQKRWQPTGPPPIPSEIGQAEIGAVFQIPFDAFAGGLALHAAQKRRLESYGWVDRPRGVIHVPIDRAMELYLAGQRP